MRCKCVSFSVLQFEYHQDRRLYTVDPILHLTKSKIPKEIYCLDNKNEITRSTEEDIFEKLYVKVTGHTSKVYTFWKFEFLNEGHTEQPSTRITWPGQRPRPNSPVAQVFNFNLSSHEDHTACVNTLFLLPTTNWWARISVTVLCVSLFHAFTCGSYHSVLCAVIIHHGFTRCRKRP